MGMRTAVLCNVRTCHECWTELSKGYDVAIRGGSVMGMLLPAMGILSLGFLHYLLAKVGGFPNHRELSEALAQFFHLRLRAGGWRHLQEGGRRWR